ncbi:hypothetical protein MRX96_025108 [Rhipicephalus microplus]
MTTTFHRSEGDESDAENDAGSDAKVPAGKKPKRTKKKTFVEVYLNGKRLPVKSFREYVQLFLKDQEDETGNPLVVAHELVTDRWEVAVTLSASGEFRQIGFVYGIGTTKGSSHVDYVSDHVVKKVLENLKKKNKAGVKIQSKQVKDYL